MFIDEFDFLKAGLAAAIYLLLMFDKKSSNLDHIVQEILDGNVQFFVQMLCQYHVNWQTQHKKSDQKKSYE